MTPEQPQEHKLPRFTVREAQMAEFLADAGNMLQTLQATEQRMRDQRALLELAADKLRQQCDRVDETTERFTKAINGVDKATRDRFTQAVVELARRTLEQAIAEIRAAGEAERQRLLHGPTGAGACRAAQAAAAPSHASVATAQADRAAGAASARPPPHQPLPLWRRYPRTNLVIGAALLTITYVIAR